MDVDFIGVFYECNTTNERDFDSHRTWLMRVEVWKKRKTNWF